ncbi:FAD-binding domain-containing protein [Delitschia confertaspora ATCC 74209]|uniref:FAD-binding domain-containing protein n=1 Tax=Delitschia confertaspora ATCC 74209 TaxID=1513339 RepID=A0A9P4JIN4_9PLEO|nr:FAD-binding domain-containing protein [Delitschia confertaspora ATCC 74209]
MASFIIRVWTLVAFVCLNLSLVKADTPTLEAITAKLEGGRACCTALDFFLPKKVFTKLHPAYGISQLSFWSAQEQSLKPACILIPETQEDVQLAVTVLNIGVKAGISSCKFAVRGAGHTPTAGAANIEDGVTIDMQKMNDVVIDAGNKAITFGPGNRWGNIFPKLDDQDLAMVGGRVSTVGTAGLITGGGVSFFSGRKGFVADNIKSATLVLANSTVVTASATSNSDLYRAIKGGTNNFGIITSFTADIFEQQKFWGGEVVQPITNKDKLIEYLVSSFTSETFDPYAALITDLIWVSGIPAVIHQLAYTDGSKSWPPPAFKPLVELPTLASTVRKSHLSDFTTEIAAAAVVTEDKNNLLVTLTFANKGEVSVNFMKEVYELADKTVKSLLSVLTLNFIMTFQPLPHALYTKGAENGNGANVLGLERFDEDLFNLLFTLSWPLALDNAKVEAAMKELEQKIKKLSQTMGVDNEFVYLNYAAGWQNPLASYGQENVNFLKSVANKYDPSGLFQTGVPGGFKLSNL